jgi:hypothetical protein
MFTHNAESARGIAPRAAHRSGLEPLDSSGSCHQMKAAAFRQGRFGSSCFQLTRPIKTRLACPLRSTGVTTPLPRYYGTVRPCPADQYFRPRGASACAFSPSTAGRFSSSVPEPGIESRHLCTGQHMASKQVSAMPFPREEGPLRFRCHLLIRFDALSVVHLRSSLYSIHDVISSHLLTMTFTTAAFDQSSSWLFEACSYKPASKGLPPSPVQHRALTSSFLTQPLHGSGQAGFPHPALALGDDAYAAQGIGMTVGRQRQPASNEAPHTIPQHAAFVAAPRQRAMPEPPYLESKDPQRVVILRHSVIADVPTHHRLKPLAYFGNGFMHPSLKFGFHLVQFRLQPFADRLPQHREPSVVPLLRTDVCEAKKVERLRFPFSTPLPLVDRIRTELQKSRLLGMQFQVELSHSFRKFCPELIGIRFAVEAHHDVVSESHHDIAVQALLTPSLDPQIEYVRMAPHDSGPMWVASSHSYDFCIHYTSPV